MLRARPRKGQTVTGFDAYAYKVIEARDDGICWMKREGADATCFIWRFADGTLNKIAEVSG